MQFTQQIGNRQPYIGAFVAHEPTTRPRVFGRLLLLLAALVLVQLGIHNGAHAAEAKAKSVASAMVQLNTASANELAQQLVGVGKTRAQAIVAYRQKVGDFRNDDELSQVKGIGRHVIEANKARISYAPSSKRLSGKTSQ